MSKPQSVTRRAERYARQNGYKYVAPLLAEVSWSAGYRAAIRDVLKYVKREPDDSEVVEGLLVMFASDTERMK